MDNIQYNYCHSIAIMQSYIYIYRLSEAFWILLVCSLDHFHANWGLERETLTMKIAQVFPHSLSIYQSHAAPLIPMSSPSCEFDFAESSFSSTIFPGMLPPTISIYLTLQNFDKPLLNGRSPKSRLSAGFACRRTSGESGVTGSCWNQRVLESMGRTP